MKALLCSTDVYILVDINNNSNNNNNKGRYR